MKSLLITLFALVLISCAYQAGVLEKPTPIPQAAKVKQSTNKADVSSSQGFQDAASTENQSSATANKMISPLTR